MQISFFAKVVLFLALYCISDLSIKNNILRKVMNRANRAKKIWTSQSMEFLTNFWNNQPTIVMGIGVAIFVLLGIYISLLQTYQ